MLTNDVVSFEQPGPDISFLELTSTLRYQDLTVFGFILDRKVNSFSSQIMVITPGRESNGLIDRVHGILCRYLDKTDKNISYFQ